jgi:hypothetical protein
MKLKILNLFKKMTQNKKGVKKMIETETGTTAAPVAPKPPAPKPVASNPGVKKPASKPAVKKPMVKKPMVQKPAAKPVAKEGITPKVIAAIKSPLCGNVHLLVNSKIITREEARKILGF